MLQWTDDEHRVKVDRRSQVNWTPAWQGKKPHHLVVLTAEGIPVRVSARFCEPLSSQARSGRGDRLAFKPIKVEAHTTRFS